MSAEIVTVDLTTAREAAYQGRHRRPVNTDVWAWWGIGGCLAVVLAGFGMLAHLAGWW